MRKIKPIVGPGKPHFRTLTAAQARSIDLLARDKLKMPVVALMENAGRGVCEEALGMLGGEKSVAVFCGRGNNGGDGFVAARHLLAAGVKPRVFFCGPLAGLSPEAGINLVILLKLKQKIIRIRAANTSSIRSKIAGCALVIDALLGVGLNKEVAGVYRQAIELINRSCRPVLSVDLPSGLDATTGCVLGAAVKAERTVTFVAPKRGMFLRDGLKICGKIVVKGLGLPL